MKVETDKKLTMNSIYHLSNMFVTVPDQIEEYILPSKSVTFWSRTFLTSDFPFEIQRFKQYYFFAQKILSETTPDAYYPSIVILIGGNKLTESTPN